MQLNGSKDLPMRLKSTRDLAAAVRGRRRDLGLTQAVLAARAGVSRKWIYEFEAGKPAAELRLILSVLEALGLALEIVYDAGERPVAGKLADLDTLIEEHRER